jgi:hypothetical protein
MRRRWRGKLYRRWFASIHGPDDSFGLLFQLIGVFREKIVLCNALYSRDAEARDKPGRSLLELPTFFWGILDFNKRACLNLQREALRKAS